MSVLEKIANMEQNMDGENNHQLGEWEKHEKDREVLEQLEHLFHVNNFLPRAEKQKARVQRAISNLQGSVRPKNSVMHDA